MERLVPATRAGTIVSLFPVQANDASRVTHSLVVEVTGKSPVYLRSATKIRTGMNTIQSAQPK